MDKQIDKIIKELIATNHVGHEFECPKLDGGECDCEWQEFEDDLRKAFKTFLTTVLKDYQKKLIDSLDKLEDGNYGSSKLIQIEQVKSLIEKSLTE
jgi:hypothetical protein